MICSQPGCKEETKRPNGALCGMHQQRRLAGKPMDAPRMNPWIRPQHRKCALDGCDRPHEAKGFCAMHWARVKRTGDPGPIGLTKAPAGTGYIDKTGYRRIGRKGAEHRMIMEQIIGRPLTKEESVHHKNGIRTDNRPENLELWVSPGRGHKAGQRPEDLVAFVVAHYPEAVRVALDASTLVRPAQVESYARTAGSPQAGPRTAPPATRTPKVAHQRSPLCLTSPSSPKATKA